MSFHKDQLEEMISQWTEQQLTSYIIKLEVREMELHAFLKELRKIRELKKRSLKKSTPDNGGRSGT